MAGNGVVVRIGGSDSGALATRSQHRLHDRFFTVHASSGRSAGMPAPVALDIDINIIRRARCKPRRSTVESGSRTRPSPISSTTKIHPDALTTISRVAAASVVKWRVFLNRTLVDRQKHVREHKMTDQR
jgi:hypothetical protein